MCEAPVTADALSNMRGTLEATMIDNNAEANSSRTWMSLQPLQDMNDLLDVANITLPGNKLASLIAKFNEEFAKTQGLFVRSEPAIVSV